MMKWVNACLTLAVFISVSLVRGCLPQEDPSPYKIKYLEFPNDVSRELTDEILFFEKNVDDQSIVAILSLDLSIFDIIFLPNEVNHPVLNPISMELTYVRSESVGSIDPHGIWVYDLRKKQEIKIAGWNEDILDIWLSSPSFSQDGKTVIFTVTWFDTGKIGLAVTDIDVGKPKVLKTNMPLSHGPILSPNGEKIIVSCPGIDQLTGQPGFQICLLDKSGSFIEQLTNRGDINSSYFFTPDGKNIAYSETEFGGLLQLFNKRLDRFIIMNTDGTNKNVFIDWDVRILGFSDDSHQIIFVSKNYKESKRGIYIINIDGTNLRHLTYFDEFLEEWYSDIEEY